VGVAKTQPVSTHLLVKRYSLSRI